MQCTCCLEERNVVFPVCLHPVCELCLQDKEMIKCVECLQPILFIDSHLESLLPQSTLKLTDLSVDLDSLYLGIEDLKEFLDEINQSIEEIEYLQTMFFDQHINSDLKALTLQRDETINFIKYMSNIPPFLTMGKEKLEKILKYRIEQLNNFQMEPVATIDRLFQEGKIRKRASGVNSKIFKTFTGYLVFGVDHFGKRCTTGNDIFTGKDLISINYNNGVYYVNQDDFWLNGEPSRCNDKEKFALSESVGNWQKCLLFKNELVILEEKVYNGTIFGNVIDIFRQSARHQIRFLTSGLVINRGGFSDFTIQSEFIFAIGFMHIFKFDILGKELKRITPKIVPKGISLFFEDLILTYSNGIIEIFDLELKSIGSLPYQNYLKITGSKDGKIFGEVLPGEWETL